MSNPVDETPPDGRDPRPLIVTLKLDAGAFVRLDALRRAHFPAALNRLSAHLTLFHHLPGERLAEVGDALAAVAAPAPRRGRGGGRGPRGRGGGVGGGRGGPRAAPPAPPGPPAHPCGCASAACACSAAGWRSRSRAPA